MINDPRVEFRKNNTEFITGQWEVKGRSTLFSILDDRKEEKISLLTINDVQLYLF